MVRETVSCDGYPQRVPGQSQCGCCTSCVLRRQALFGGGLADYDHNSGYRRDILSGIKQLEPDESHGFMVMNEQVKLMARCLESGQPWHELSIAYPELARTVVELSARPGALTREDLADSYVELIRTTCTRGTSSPLKSRPRLGDLMQENVVHALTPGSWDGVFRKQGEPAASPRRRWRSRWSWPAPRSRPWRRESAASAPMN